MQILEHSPELPDVDFTYNNPNSNTNPKEITLFHGVSKKKTHACF